MAVPGIDRGPVSAAARGGGGPGASAFLVPKDIRDDIDAALGHEVYVGMKCASPVKNRSNAARSWVLRAWAN